MPVSSNQPTNENDSMREDLLSSKKVLFISAHPDDIEFYCGGVVSMLCECDACVIFAIGTRGGKGCKGWRKRRFERLRTQHQMDSARILGGAKIVFFDYPDKELHRFIDPFARDLKELIDNEHPDIILSWDPDYIYNPHSDHQAAADAARFAATGSDARIAYYGTRKPNLWIGFDEETYRIKLKSLKAHRTETPWYFFDLLTKKPFVEKLMGEGKKIGAKYAEVLRVVWRPWSAR